MPTDVLRSLQNRRSRQCRTFWHDSALIVAISGLGAAFTIVRAVQSEAFLTALSLAEALE